MTGKIAAKKPFMLDLFSLLQDFAIEGQINLNEDGVSINQLDAANVSGLMLDINKEAFEAYEPFDGELYGNWSDIQSTLKRFKKSSVVTLEFDGDDVELYSEHKSFTKPLLDIRVGNIREVPDVNDDEVKLSLDDMSDVIKDVKTVSKDNISVNFHFTDGVIVDAQSNRQSYQQALAKRDNDTKYKVRLGLNFIDDAISSIDNMFDEATFCFSEQDGMPLVIEASMDDVQLQYMLAPRHDNKS